MDQSPLARLAPKLRKRIYKLVQEHEAPIMVSDPHRNSSGENLSRHHYLALMRTCRKVRAESLQLFYTTNTFAFEPGIWQYQNVEERSMVAFDSFRRAISGKSAAALRTVVIGVLPPHLVFNTDRMQVQFRETVEQLYERAQQGDGCTYKLSMRVCWCIKGSHSYNDEYKSDAMTMVIEMDDFEKSCLAAEKRLSKLAGRVKNATGKRELSSVIDELQYCRAIVDRGGS
ncbi:hypothetical protein LTR36_003235 [Oleoguttula mirabilis]|uniref:Uncharacterized protein n=1 Tax=Oleoguttula mirabilis TaxID=1507867 RepID=A0AAV9JXC0_9PEZI|nr:hypothetical protein LTR36_003235 [Oleoguttula mirabilis]